MGFFALLLLYTAMAVGTALLASRRRDTSQAPEVRFPEVRNGDPLPVLWGRRRIPLVLVWTPKITQKKVEGTKEGDFLGIGGTKPVIGYDAYVRLQAVLCWGPLTSVDDVVFDDNKYYTTQPGTTRRIVGYTQTGFSLVPIYEDVPKGTALSALAWGGSNAGMKVFTFDLPDLYGGKTKAGGQGGVTGEMEVYPGWGVQEASAYMLAQPAVIPYIGTSTYGTPAYQDVAHVVFRNMNMGMTANLKPWEFVVTRYADALGLSGIGDVPGTHRWASILWDLLTNKLYGLGVPEALLDQAHWKQTIVDNDMGIAVYLGAQGSAQEVIDDILETVDAVMDRHPVSGKYRVIPIRGGYTESTLPAFSEDNALSLEWTRREWAETINDVTVVFSDAGRGFRDNSVTVKSEANIAMTGSVRPQRFEYRTITDIETATRVAARELRAGSVPLGSGRIKVTRKGSLFMKGDLLSVSWTRYGLHGVICRVLAVNAGTVEEGYVELDIVEDVFQYDEPITSTGGSTGTPEPGTGTTPLRLPQVTEHITRDPTTGTLALTIGDPDNTVTGVTFSSQSGLKPATAPVADTEPYQHSVALDPQYPSYITSEVSYTLGSGETGVIGRTVRFEITQAAALPVISYQWITADTVRFTAVSGVTGQQVKLLGGTAAPTDAAVLADTPGASPQTVDVVVSAEGGTAYAAAAGWDGVANSAVVPSTATRPTTASSIAAAAPIDWMTNRGLLRRYIPPNSTVELIVAHPVRHTQDTGGVQSARFQGGVVTGLTSAQIVLQYATSVGGTYVDAGPTFDLSVTGYHTAASMTTLAAGARANLSWRAMIRSGDVGGVVQIAALTTDFSATPGSAPLDEGGDTGSTGGGGTGGGGGTTPSDPSYSQVELLLHLDGVSGQTTTTDVSDPPKPMTMAGGAAIATAGAFNGGSSLSVNGGSVTTPDDPSFALAAGAFTLEAQARASVAPSGVQTILGQWGGTTDLGYRLGLNGGQLQFQYTTDGVTVQTISAAYAPALDAWVHYAVTRDVDTIRVFANGALIVTGTTAAGAVIHNSARPFVVGNEDAGTAATAWPGLMDEVRVTVGLARYTAAFAAPTTPLPGAPAPGTGGPVIPIDPTNPIPVTGNAALDIMGVAGLPFPNVSTVAAEGGAYQRYEEDWRQWIEYHWTEYGSWWESANYYDRAMIYYVWYARTGNTTYLTRGHEIALVYRKNYLEDNNYGASPHWSQLDGIAIHYLLTGDEASKLAVGRTAARLQAGYLSQLGTIFHDWMENRIVARVVLSAALAHRIGVPNSVLNDEGISGTWADAVSTGVSKGLSAQTSDGAYPYQGSGQFGRTKPFMDGIWNMVLMRIPTLVGADARILPAVQKSCDYLWANAWVAADGGFGYHEGDSGGAGDLNGLMVPMYAYVAHQSTDATVQSTNLTRANTIFVEGVARAFLSGPKQFNEEYSVSWSYFKLTGRG